jgi:hypothetical protein
VFTARWTPTARDQFEAIQAAAHKAGKPRAGGAKSKSSRQEGLFKQVRKTVLLLMENPRHPGLQTLPHYSLGNPYDPSAKVFEAYAQQHTPGACRVFWCYGPGPAEITLLAITPHP